MEERVFHGVVGRGRSESGDGRSESKGSRRGGGVGKVIRELKEGMAMGVDGIPREAWKYGGGDMERWV